MNELSFVEARTKIDSETKILPHHSTVMPAGETALEACRWVRRVKVKTSSLRGELEMRWGNAWKWASRDKAAKSCWALCFQTPGHGNTQQSLTYGNTEQLIYRGKVWEGQKREGERAGTTGQESKKSAERCEEERKLLAVTPANFPKDVGKMLGVLIQIFKKAKYKEFLCSCSSPNSVCFIQP